MNRKEELVKSEERVVTDTLLIVKLEISTNGTTRLHKHAKTQECYQILSGSGKAIIGKEERTIKSGDLIHIPPKTPHKIWNTGGELFPLVVLSIKDSGDRTDVIDLEGSAE